MQVMMNLLEHQVSSFFNVSAGQYSPRMMLLIFLFLAGLTCIIIGGKHLMKMFIHHVAPEKKGKIKHILFKSNELSQGKTIAVLGGGTGLKSLLTGLKKHTNNITAIITVADEGGSSRQMRDDFGELPPGDMRNCLVALSDSGPLLAKLLQYRFKVGTLKGHPIGNLLITAMAKVTGSFEKGIAETSKILNIQGRVLPVSLGRTHLCAELENGKVIREEPEVEHHTIKYKSKIKRLFLDPHVHAYKEAIKAIKRSDIVVLGPGSLYTSVLPNILVKGISEAIKSTGAKVVYVCNVMTQPGETDGYSAHDHVAQIEKYLGVGILDYIIVNADKAPEKIYKKYKAQGAERVDFDEQRLKEFGAEIVQVKLMTKLNLLRHDPDKLAEAVIKLE